MRGILLVVLSVTSPLRADPGLETAGLSHLMRGLHFLSQNHPAAAVPHLRLALLYDPDSPFIHLKLSEAWGRAGDEGKAQAAVEAGLSMAPKDPMLNYRAGLTELRNRRYRRAERHLTLASVDEVTRERAAAQLADAKLWLGKRKEARGIALRFADGATASAELSYRLGAAFEDHGELETALELYRRARVQRPASRPTAVGEMRVLELMGKPTEAATALIELFAHYPNDGLLFLFAHRLLRRANAPDAEAYLREAKRLARVDPRARIMVANALVSEGRAEAALRYLDRPERESERLFLATIEQMRGRPGACASRLVSAKAVGSRLRRARCLAESGRLEDGLAVLGALAGGEVSGEQLAQEAAVVSSWAPSVETARVRLRGFLKTHDRAFSESDRALATSVLVDHYGFGAEAIRLVEGEQRGAPRDDNLKLRLADLYARYDQFDRGIALLEELVDASPGSAVRLNALGFTLADAAPERELERAAVLLRRAYRLSLDDGYIVDSLGWLMYRMGRLDEARDLVQRALQLDGPDPEVLRHLGDIQRARGEEAAAQRAYRAALDRNPPAPLAGLLRERLKTRGPRGVRASRRQKNRPE
ncbi:MAG: tetratricopeptide repeat protein [Myxococcota bacterium]